MLVREITVQHQYYY